MKDVSASSKTRDKDYQLQNLWDEYYLPEHFWQKVLLAEVLLTLLEEKLGLLEEQPKVKSDIGDGT